LDGGQTWTVLNKVTDLPHELTTIEMDPVNPDKLYAGTGGQGMYLSTNAGQEWSQTAMQVPADLGAAIAVDPEDGDRLYGHHSR
jgi:hypothetical protein